MTAGLETLTGAKAAEVRRIVVDLITVGLGTAKAGPGEPMGIEVRKKGEAIVMTKYMGNIEARDRQKRKTGESVGREGDVGELAYPKRADSELVNPFGGS